MKNKQVTRLLSAAAVTLILWPTAVAEASNAPATIPVTPTRTTNLGSPLDIVFPELTMYELPLKHALDLVMKLAKENGAPEAGFRGIIVIDPDVPAAGITMSLKMAPLGFILRMMANVTSCHFAPRGGVYALHPFSFERSSVARAATPLSDSTKHQLGLSGQITPEERRAAISRLGIRLDDEATVRFVPDRNLLIVDANREEVELLESVLLLLNRGLKVHTP